MKHFYKQLLFKFRYFIWKHTDGARSVKEFARLESSKRLMDATVELLDRQGEYAKKNPDAPFLFHDDYRRAVIHSDWLERIDAKIEETKPTSIRVQEEKEREEGR